MKLFIGIPTTGNIRIELAQFLLNFARVHDVTIDIVDMVDICHNRNLIVKHFLQTECDYLMMCDSDIVPQLNIMGILDSEKDIITPINMTFKNGELIPLALKKEGDGYTVSKELSDKEKPIIEVDNAGTGCVFIKKEVFAKLPKPYFESGRDEDGILVNSEDFIFFEKAKAHGFKIFVDRRFVTSHFHVVNLAEVRDGC